MSGYPMHVVCEWIGNSPKTAAKHYLQVTPQHIAKAIHLGGGNCGGSSCTKPSEMASNRYTKDMQKPRENANSPGFMQLEGSPGRTLAPLSPGRYFLISMGLIRTNPFRFYIRVVNPDRLWVCAMRGIEYQPNRPKTLQDVRVTSWWLAEAESVGIAGNLVANFEDPLPQESLFFPVRFRHNRSHIAITDGLLCLFG